MTMGRIIGVFWLLFGCWLPSASANESSFSPPVDVLAHTDRWLALLHWNQGTTLHSRGQSYVKDPQFFLSPHGQNNPTAELNASIHALKAEGSPARCQFPARFRFLADALHWPTEDAFNHCDEYQQWRAEVPDGRIVLVFPATYLNSPSSMFGHTLLRLDKKDEEEDVWLSWAVNFGAVVGNAEGSMLYIYRGLAGGYDGYFSTLAYHSKVQDYGHIENRDMWEYPLALTEEERQWVIEHLWEMKDIRFDYLFLDENCSLRLLELVHLARPQADLMADFRLTEIPVNTVRAVEQAGLIEEPAYRPSKAVELKAHEALLTHAQRRFAVRLAHTPELVDSETFEHYTTAEQQRVLNAAYQWLRFQQQGKQRDTDSARRSMALLRLLNQYPKAPPASVAMPERPETGHPTKMMAATFGAQDNRSLGQWEYRLTYHDWLDPPAGFLPGAHIEALQMKWRYQESDTLRLQELKVVDIRSLSPRSTFIKPLSWFVRGGFERTAVAGEYRLASYLEGGPGAAWQWRSFRPYVYATGRVEHHGEHQQYFQPGLGSTLGLLWHAPRQVVVGLNVDNVYFLHGSQRHTMRLSANVPVHRQHALRVEIAHEAWRNHGDTEGHLSWRYYFD